MSESTTMRSAVEGMTGAVKKAFSSMGTRVETAVTELDKLQSRGVEQASAIAETAGRAAKESVAFAEQIGGEWRNLVLSAARSATGLFTPKA